MNSSRALLYPHDPARDALNFSHMFVGFLKWKTIGPGKQVSSTVAISSEYLLVGGVGRGRSSQ
jgi:hypothetical protein